MTSTTDNQRTNDRIAIIRATLSAGVVHTRTDERAALISQLRQLEAPQLRPCKASDVASGADVRLPYFPEDLRATAECAIVGGSILCVVTNAGFTYHAWDLETDGSRVVASSWRRAS